MMHINIIPGPVNWGRRISTPVKTFPQECLRYDTKLYLMVIFLSYSLGECGFIVITARSSLAHIGITRYSPINRSNRTVQSLTGLLLLLLLLLFKTIQMCENFLYSIKILAKLYMQRKLKKSNSVHVKYHLTFVRTEWKFAQSSVGGVQYTYCISAKG